MENEKRPYNIMPNDIVEISRQDIGDYTFYKVKFSKTFKEDKVVEYSKILNFPPDTNIKDGAKVKLLEFHEDAFYSKYDKYNAIWVLRVTDYEIVDGQIKAIEDFNNRVERQNNDYDLPF